MASLLLKYLELAAAVLMLLRKKKKEKRETNICRRTIYDIQVQEKTNGNKKENFRQELRL